MPHFQVKKYFCNTSQSCANHWGVRGAAEESWRGQERSKTINTSPWNMQGTMSSWYGKGQGQLSYFSCLPGACCLAGG